MPTNTALVVNARVTEDTQLQGYFTAPYSLIVEKLGEPLPAGDKTLAEWTLRLDGEVATVYDWKNYGSTKERITSWNIGGEDGRSVHFVSRVLGVRAAPAR